MQKSQGESAALRRGREDRRRGLPSVGRKLVGVWFLRQRGGGVFAPTFTPSGGTYTTAQSVTISSATSGATIRYTTDGSAPTKTEGAVYAGPVAVSAPATIRAVAYSSGGAASPALFRGFRPAGFGCANLSL